MIEKKESRIGDFLYKKKKGNHETRKFTETCNTFYIIFEIDFYKNKIMKKVFFYVKN